jgi:L-threonylcarbamoyladenylate synthase
VTQVFAGAAGIERAASVLRDGGVIGYPTEGVFGLGCDPMNLAAVRRVARIKQRSEALGFILIASASSRLIAGLTVRLTVHPIASQLCRSFGGPVVSTSANPHGKPSARRVGGVVQYFSTLVDGVVEGDVDLNVGPSQASDLAAQSSRVHAEPRQPRTGERILRSNVRR